MKRGLIAVALLSLILLSGCAIFEEKKEEAPTEQVTTGTQASEQEKETEPSPVYETEEPEETEKPIRRFFGGGGGAGGGGGVASGSGGGGGAGGEVATPATVTPSAEPTPETKVSDKTVCQNAQGSNLCNGLGVAYGNGYQQLCCQEQGLCC